MSEVVFVVDSGSDYEQDNRSGITRKVEFVPLNSHFGDEVFLDAIDFTKDEFYVKMANSPELPKTSQPSPQAFYDVFKRNLDEGKEIITITISSDLSGTFQSATIAKDMLTEEEQQKVHLVDSRNVSVVLVYLMKRADNLLNEGKSVKEVVQWLDANKDKTTVYALLDTLENLKKGGRISAAQAMIGGLLNIKPLITLKDGKVESLGKARGRKKGIKELVDIIGDIEQYDRDYLFIVHSFLSEEEAREEAKAVVDESQFQEVFYFKLGSTIGTHAGTNAIAIVLKRK